MGELGSWKFCPRCRAELEVTGDGAKAHCPQCGFEHYASSKPTASAIVLDDRGRVLLARRALEPDRGKWDLPGGFLDEGEDPRAGLERELEEETGLTIDPVEFFDVVVDRYGEGNEAQRTLNLYWLARIVRGEPEPADDVAELRWFGRDELPSARELAFRNNAQILSAWRARDERA